MHSYLRSIGFSNINNRSELNKLINLVLDDYLIEKQYK